MVNIELLTLSVLQQAVCLSEEVAKYYRIFAWKFLFTNSTPRPVFKQIILKDLLIMIICAKRFLSSNIGRNDASLQANSEGQQAT